MEILISILLGILQGLTEFLPVSSSGHLAFFEKIFGNKFTLTQGEAHLFNVMVHLATVLAVILVFRKTISSLLKTLFNKSEYKNYKQSSNLNLITLIIVASIPTAIIGFFGRKLFQNIQHNLLLIGLMFFITAGLLFLTKFVKSEKKDDYTQIGILNAIIVGIVQGLAVAPGISRSGSTISTSRFLGISREKAGEFSFLIAIPVIIGASILEIYKSKVVDANIIIFIAGFISSFITGYFALKFLLSFIRKGKLYYFGFYVIIIGIISIVLHGSNV